MNTKATCPPKLGERRRKALAERTWIVAAFVALVSFTLHAQVGYDRLLNAAKEPRNWLTYSGGYFSNRYSLLTQIGPANVKNLELKWMYRRRSPAAGRRRRSSSMA